MTVDTDEHPRARPRSRRCGNLRPAFKADGNVTAGNASGINDGAAAVVVMTASKAAELGLKPRCASSPAPSRRRRPGDHGLRPDPGDRRRRSNAPASRVDDIDTIELNEAFASVAAACSGARPDPGEDEPQRRRDRPRPPGRRDRHDPGREADVRAGAHRRPLRPRLALHRRRPGHRGDLREHQLAPRPHARTHRRPSFHRRAAAFCCAGARALRSPGRVIVRAR